ncbi:hypothetical protein EUGRSUZ_C03962 [Eucalyptus grandis]|uniref:Uncharacterized protein n=2 Tax=Eucalyptus grandis TaxID=71139 RepID=A0ACC3LLT6_EUCGR|nr:hypothetical protein EUGRSUZ_C03962 [Eucalyptus grandis]
MRAHRLLSLPLSIVSCLFSLGLPEPGIDQEGEKSNRLSLPLRSFVFCFPFGSLPPRHHMHLTLSSSLFPPSKKNIEGTEPKERSFPLVVKEQK